MERTSATNRRYLGHWFQDLILTLFFHQSTESN
jgi:hypothetical protein